MILRIIFGIFLVLHGLVHLFYAGQARRLFELQAEMVWPDGSWAFSKLLGEGTTRLLASITYVLATIGFLIGAAGLFLGQAWWRPVVTAAAAFSAVMMVLFWNGKMERLPDQGAIGVLINIGIIVVVNVLGWPS